MIHEQSPQLTTDATMLCDFFRCDAELKLMAVYGFVRERAREHGWVGYRMSGSLSGSSQILDYCPLHDEGADPSNPKQKIVQ